MSSFLNLKTLVLDGSNNKYATQKAEELCCKFGVKLVITKQTGAYILYL